MLFTFIIACIFVNFGIMTVLMIRLINKNAIIRLLESTNKQYWDMINDIIGDFKEISVQVEESTEKCTEIVNQIDDKSN